ncbi:hypothetical protein PR048_022798 [Dryococelus australis]|uniref:Major facilitator superfamily (MFS) profile domain-containing protein n=1 Tax=Dryococelus australis TaxID=614101 RepID=A0ABQ9GSC1_9NEOP|nr:hypothetical protein PR048_022798 [Dryococelus australis]
MCAFVAVNGIAFVSGSAYGWPAPMLPLLQSLESPLEGGAVSSSEASWLSSIMTAMRLASIPAYMWTHDRLGRKVTAYLIAVPSSSAGPCW